MLADAEGKLKCEYVKDYVVFDLETTGISSAYDEVVEISAVKVKNEVVVDEFTTLVNPHRLIPAAASNVNGITDDMVKDAPSFDVALKEFIEFIGELPLVGHNIHSFDMKFIQRDCQKYFGKLIGNDYIDTLKIARTYMSELAKRSLVDLAIHYGISPDGAHRALNDCRMNQKVYYHLKDEMDPEKLKSKGQKNCPKCNALLKIRNGMYGEFWGCTSFPACRYTENIPK